MKLYNYGTVHFRQTQLFTWIKVFLCPLLLPPHSPLPHLLSPSLHPLQRCRVLGQGLSHWELEVTSSLPVWRLLAICGLSGPALVPAVGAEVQVSPSATAPPTENGKDVWD